MADLKWLKIAEQSENPEIQGLVLLYKTAETGKDQLDAERQIKQILFPKNVLDVSTGSGFDKDELAPELKEKEHKEFLLTLQDVEEAKLEDFAQMIRDCDAELKYMRETAPKKMTPEVRKSYVKRRTFVQNMRETLVRRRIDLKNIKKRNERKVEIKNLKIKQLQIINLLRQGISFDRMLQRDDGLKLNVLVACMEEDDTIYKEFPNMKSYWPRWKEKRVEKTETGYKIK